jgi:hypothetical protein
LEYFADILKEGRCKFLVAIFILGGKLIAQDQYFQQEVNYKIRVSLNDVKHELSAFEEITYINNSVTSLSYIYFHLWPNAYKDHSTALAKQFLENGETDFYFSKKEERGYIDSLDFKVNGKPVKIEYDPKHIDICKIILNEPMRSHDTIVISTPFHVKLPDAKFSRLGHSGQAYYITQWYPKPAVFDNTGWHQMPYLNQGEFYSEYGTFDVSVTVPQNYLLAATGDRIDAREEEEWLNNKVMETEVLLKAGQIADKKNQPFPQSSSVKKTIRFMQSNVHDFAWFADKRFRVLRDQIKLPNSGRIIDTWIFFTDNEASLWQNALEYVDDATLFYSYFVGDYPYNHVTAIDGVIAAGGGMEYPNITVIGESKNSFVLEETIMHEVGHNWFYGILGSNERDHPFMDEGLNSFYEMRYIQAKYPNKKLTSLIGRDSTFKFFGLNRFPHKEYYNLAYLLAARKNSDQPINTEAAKFTSYNYGAIVYAKSAIVFDYLMSAVGNEKFDDGMRFYFDNWKFKHPSPKDLQKTLEYHCAIDMNWFVDGMLNSTEKVDYKILKHHRMENGGHEVLVKGKGKISGPVSMMGYKKGKLVGQVWYSGFEGIKRFEFPPSEVDKFVIDGQHTIPEINRKNNNLKLKGMFKRTEPFELNFIGKLDDPNKTQLNWFPVAGYNAYNKFMIGLAFYNYSILQKRFEFSLAPMYAFGSNTPVGFAEMQFNFAPNQAFQKVSIGARFKSFAYDFSDPDKFFPGTNVSDPSFFAFNYYKAEPFLKLDIKKKDPRSPVNQSITMRSVIRLTQEDHTYTTVFTEVQRSPYKKDSLNYVNELSYTLNNTRVIDPFGLSLKLQQNGDMAKIALTANYSISFKNKSSLDFRVFAGSFISGKNKGAYRFRASGWNGYHDYMFDYNYVGRNEYNGLGFAQFAEEDGAMKVWTPLGQSDTWLVSLNIRSPKFFKLPVRLFVDAVTCDKAALLNDQILYDAGFEISVWKDIFEIYVPLAYSKDITNTLKLNNKATFFETLRFTLNINKINLREMLNSNLK